MRFLRSARAIQSVLLALALFASVACSKHTSPAPTTTGGWLDAGGTLLMVIERSGDVHFYYVAGMGSCVDQFVEATVEGSNLVLPSGTKIPISIKGDSLIVSDPSGSIGGTFARVEYNDLCHLDVPPPGAVSSRTRTLVPTAATDVASGKSRTVTFTMPADAVSFALDIFGQDVGYEGIVISSLEPPSGGNLLTVQPALEECFNGYCGVFLPKAPGFDPEPGTYRARIEGSGAIDDAHLSVRLVTRPGPYTPPTRLHVHPVVGPTSTTDAEITSALAAMKKSLESHGLLITIDPLTKLTDPRFRAPVADFLHPVTVELMSNGSPDAINLFLCDDLVGLEGLFGIASGIPGSLGVVGPWNGVLVNLAMHRTATSLSIMETLTTIVHEPGHLLGLYHVTEADGRTFDILGDTPECDARSHDVDDDGYVLADECLGAGGDYVMFWTPSTSDGSIVRQNVLSPDQVDVISRSVIGQ